MSESNETIRGEIEEYISDMNKTRHDLINFQTSRMDNTVLASEVGVAITAIDSVLQKLSVPNLAENVDLNTIVHLAEQVTDIKTTSSRILSKKVM